MHRFNLNNVSKQNLQVVENYLNNQIIITVFFEDFAESSITENFYSNQNNLHLIETIELSIIHYEIFLANKELVQKILSLEDKENILEILLISIEEEKTNRFKRKLENICNISDKRSIKDIDFIDKKIKI